MMDDKQLLHAYARERSESAFGELVARHIDFVYSTALRVVSGDSHLAEDVAQTVFIDLARKAGSLPGDVGLAGWLHHHTCYTAAKAVRTERRRKTREETAMEMRALDDNTRPEWEQVAPYLDESLDQLNPADRDALVLRFLKQQDLRAVGAALGISDDAARKRVDRALENLHVLLKHRGATLSAAALGTALATEAVTAAPAGLAGAVTAAALSGTGITTAAVIAATKATAMTTLQKALITAAIASSVGTGIYEARQASAMRSQFQSLQEQEVSLNGRNQELSKQRDEVQRQLTALREDNERLNRNTGELLKLRGEVARLRQDSLDLASLKASDANGPSGLVASAWLSRLTQLKQHLDQSPGMKIPELKYLTDAAWLKAAQAKLETEDDYRRAFAALRSSAEGAVGTTLQSSLRKYLAANNNVFPSDIGQLKPYFDSPVEEAILQRYEIVPASDLKSIKLGDAAWLITQKAPVDEEYDSRMAISATSVGSVNYFRDSMMQTLDAAFTAYKSANNGELPADLSKVAPYITTAAERTALQKAIDFEARQKH